MSEAAAHAQEAFRKRLLYALLIGNFVIGVGVLAPAGMMNTLVAAFDASPAEVGGLIGWGAVVLCIGAPTLAFLSNRMERRTLLAGVLLLYTLGHAASAFATDLGALLAARLAMISAAAIFTPQAASIVGQLSAPHRAASSITFVFLGWTLATAVGVPLVTIAAEAFGWRAAYGGIAALALIAAAGVWASVPARLHAPPLSLASWREVATNPSILSLLAVTATLLAGQFMLFPYLAAELKRAAGAAPGEIALGLSLYGVAGFVGAVAATRLVGRVGPQRGVLFAASVIAAGLLLWPFLNSHPLTASAAIAVWGLGFAAVTSMQQARLAAVAPELSSASIALNTSVLYAGQAIGAGVGGALIEAGRPGALSWAGFAAILLAGALSWRAMTRYRA